MRQRTNANGSRNDPQFSFGCEPPETISLSAAKMVLVNDHHPTTSDAKMARRRAMTNDHLIFVGATGSDGVPIL